jgi:hypothetical protein
MNNKIMPKPVHRQYFVYTTPMVDIAATIGATAAFTITINADANFECNYISGIAVQVNVIVLNWAGLVQVNDSAVGKVFFNTPIAFESIAGTGKEPYPLNPPRLIRARSALNITFTNAVATATSVQLSFHGNKLFSGEDALTADFDSALM